MRSLTATLCLTLAVLLGSAGVSVSQDFQVGMDAAQRGDFAIALREWTALAEQGYADAQNNLGAMYNADGVGVELELRAVRLSRI
jgi:TPR repeat protein